MISYALKLSIAIAVAAVFQALPAAVRADIKVLNPMPWMVLTGYSETQKFNCISSIFVDRKRGDIWVADSGNHQIVEFDSKGTPLFKFRVMSVDQETGEAVPGTPLSLAVDSSGQIFVLDGASDRIAQYDYRGRLIQRINVAKMLGVERAEIHCLRVDGSDNLYFVEGGTLSLIELNRDQAFVRKVSLKRSVKTDSSAKSTTQTSTVESVISFDIGVDGKIYLVYTDENPLVRVLDSTGKELVGFGDLDDIGWENFERPTCSVSIDDGTFWIADLSSSIVKQYAPDGKYQQYIGGGPGARQGEMISPVAMATDGKDNLYVAELGTNRIQTFSLK